MNTKLIDQLFALCMELPAPMAKIEALCQQASPDELGYTACKYADGCFLERRDFTYYNHREPRAEEVHSGYLLDIFSIFLQAGMDPNYKCGEKYSEESVISLMRYIDFEYVGVNTLRLLLENGGSPWIMIEGESLYGAIEFDVWYDDMEDRHLYDVWVRELMVMIGYGGHPLSDREIIRFSEGFSIEILRQHELLEYTFGQSENGVMNIHRVSRKNVT